MDLSLKNTASGIHLTSGIQPLGTLNVCTTNVMAIHVMAEIFQSAKQWTDHMKTSPFCLIRQQLRFSLGICFSCRQSADYIWVVLRLRDALPSPVRGFYLDVKSVPEVSVTETLSHHGFISGLHAFSGSEITASDFLICVTAQTH